MQLNLFSLKGKSGNVSFLFNIKCIVDQDFESNLKSLTGCSLIKRLTLDINIPYIAFSLHLKENFFTLRLYFYCHGISFEGSAI